MKSPDTKQGLLLLHIGIHSSFLPQIESYCRKTLVRQSSPMESVASNSSPPSPLPAAPFVIPPGFENSAPQNSSSARPPKKRKTAPSAAIGCLWPICHFLHRMHSVDTCLRFSASLHFYANRINYPLSFSAIGKASRCALRFNVFRFFVNLQVKLIGTPWFEGIVV